MSGNWGKESYWEETHGGNWVFFSTVGNELFDLAMLQLTDDDPDFKRYRIIIFDGMPPTASLLINGRTHVRQDQGKAEVEEWWSQHCGFAARGWLTLIPALEVVQANGDRIVDPMPRSRITAEGMKHIAPPF